MQTNQQELIRLVEQVKEDRDIADANISNIPDYYWTAECDQVLSAAEALGIAKGVQMTLAVLFNEPVQETPKPLKVRHLSLVK